MDKDGWGVKVRGGYGGIREGEGYFGGHSFEREKDFFFEGELWVLDQGEICVWDLHIGPGLLEVLGSEGQDIRRYPGTRLFS